MFSRICLEAIASSVLLLSIMTSQSLLAFHLDLYGEHSTWIYDVEETSLRPSFEDSALIRVRGYVRDEQSLLRPYLLASSQRERVNKSWGYERQRSQFGVGVRFSREKLPFQVHFEGRRFEEILSSGVKSSQRGDEFAAILSFGGHVGTHGQDDLLLSWYGDISQVERIDAASYASGSGWFRVSAVSLGSTAVRFEMNPFDASVYRECVDACRSWVLAGVGLVVSYQSELVSLSLRSNFGERIDFGADHSTRSRDTARFLLLASGEL